MTQDTALIIVAIVLILMTPIVPNMVRLRVKFLRWIKWNSIAAWHERNIKALTLVGLIIMVVIAVCLIGIVVDKI